MYFLTWAVRDHDVGANRELSCMLLVYTRHPNPPAVAAVPAPIVITAGVPGTPSSAAAHVAAIGAVGQHAVLREVFHFGTTAPIPLPRAVNYANSQLQPAIAQLFGAAPPPRAALPVPSYVLPAPLPAGAAVPGVAVHALPLIPGAPATAALQYPAGSPVNNWWLSIDAQHLGGAAGENVRFHLFDFVNRCALKP